jgi:hypothetical protein
MKRTLFTVVVFIIAFILYCALFGAPLHAQRTNTVYVDQMRGSTVAAKTINAQAQCLAAVKCVLVFDPILGGYALGTMPSKGANEFWADYAGITGVSDLGGTVSSGLADPGGAGPIKRTTAGVTASGEFERPNRRELLPGHFQQLDGLRMFPQSGDRVIRNGSMSSVQSWTGEHGGGDDQLQRPGREDDQESRGRCDD